MEKEIEIINKIIKESIIHGADAGGSYEQNEYNLIVAINEWLIFKGLHHRYTVEEDVYVGDGWAVHQIVPVKDDLSWLENLNI
jgi:hypothetical protein